MTVNRLIKNFTFDGKIRSGLTFSDPDLIRLNVPDFEPFRLPKIQLKADARGFFSTDADIFVETPLIEPRAVQKWLKFEVLVIEEKGTFALPAGTSLGFKIKTSSGNLFWNGSAWVTAGASDWNTEKDVNDNLPALSIASIGDKKIGFVMNLVTTDKRITPEVLEIKFAGEFDIEFLKDIVYSSLIRKLNTEFRSTSVLRFRTDSSISSIDLNAKLENKGYNVTDVTKVLNLTDDTLKLSNLSDVYTPGAVKRDGFTFAPGTVTLTSPISGGKVVEVIFEHVPEVYVRQGQDFFEVPTYPSLIFENISDINRKGFTLRDTNSLPEEFIRDKPNLTAILQKAPRQSTLRFDYAVFTNSQSDQVRLVNDFNQFLANNKILTSFGLDCEYGIQVVERLDTRNQREADDTDTNVATGVFDVLGVLFFDKPSEDVPLVGEGQFTVTTTLLS